MGVDDVTACVRPLAAVVLLLIELNLARQPFEMLHDTVAGDAVKVRGERTASGVVLLGIAHQGHEDILHDFLGGPGVAGHPQSKAVDGRLVPTIDERESVLVALGNTAKQYVVPEVLLNPRVSRCDVVARPIRPSWFLFHFR